MKKLIAIVCLSIGIMLTLPHSSFACTQGDSVSDQETNWVCCKLQEQCILDIETALQWEKEGLLTIEKVEAGKYHVEIPGIGLGILLEDNL